MLPDADDFPTIRPQASEVAFVADAVGAEFVAPEFRELVFPRGQPPTMPEISVDEHGEPFFCKNDVGAARQRADVTTKFKTVRLKFSLHQSLQRAIFQFHALHRARPLRRRQVISHRIKLTSFEPADAE